MITPRPYQQAAHDEIWAHFRSGVGAVVCVMPTGAGKTVLSSMSIRHVLSGGGRVMFVAHRKELLEQPVRLLEGLGIPCGRIQGGRAPMAARQVQVASVQALCARKAPPPPADLLVIDEAHRAKAKSYINVLERYDEHDMRRPKVLGLTATPWRLDGAPLRDVFQCMVLGPSVQDLIREGNLIAPTVYRPSPGQFNDGDVVRVMPMWKQHAQHTKTIIFAPTVERSKEYVQEFTDAGVPAAHIDGNTEARVRDSAVADLMSGKITVLSNVNIATEGLDVPDLECVVLARPTQSLTMYLQQVGRVMRPAAGKSGAVVLDCAGLVFRHGSPLLNRVWDLDTDAGASMEKSDKIMLICSTCFAAYEGPPYVCPACGAQPERIGRDAPQEYDGQLEKDTSVVVRDIGPTACPKCHMSDIMVGPVRKDNKRIVKCSHCGWRDAIFDHEAASSAGRDVLNAAFNSLCALAKQRGHRAGWVVNIMKSKYPDQCVGKEQAMYRAAKQRGLR